MFDNISPYTLQTETVDGVTRYYVSFADGVGDRHITEVSQVVYLEFLRFSIKERSLRHWDERHREYSDLSDEAIYNRALYQQKALEDTVIDDLRNEHLCLAIQQLPETQQCRFLLYHDFGLTYKQIAEIEGCTTMPVKRSIDRAQEKIREIMKNF